MICRKERVNWVNKGKLLLKVTTKESMLGQCASFQNKFRLKMVFQLQTRNRLWEFRKILKRGPFSNEIWIEYGSFKVSNSGIWQVVVFLMQKIGRTGYIEEKSKYLVRVRPTMCEN